jgi:predicted DNA-binding transcriptional regulator YafY
MPLNDKCKQIDNLASLIDRKITGNAAQLAKRINVSRSKLYEIFDDLKLLGIEIQFDRKLNTFYYANNLIIRVNTPIKIITQEEIEMINGGSNRYSSSNFLNLNCA